MRGAPAPAPAQTEHAVIVGWAVVLHMEAQGLQR
jgi:hypothetical protein